MDLRNSVSIISNRSDSQPLSRRRVGSHGILRKLKQLVKVKTLIHDLTQDQFQMIGDYTKILDKHYYEMRSKLGYIVSTNEIYLNNKFIVNLPKQERREEQQDKETVNFIKQLTTVWSPSSTPYIIWTLFTIILIVIQMLEIPFNFAYTIESPSSMYDTLQVFDQIVLYAFLLDILVQFNTAIYLNGKMEISRYIIAKEYLKCWFWIDFVSSLPYDYILDDGSLSKQAQLIQFMRFFKFIKVIRLLRAFKLKKIIHRVEEYISVIQWLFQTVQIIKLFLLIMLISHYVACIWSILAFQEYPNWMSSYGIDNLQWDEQYVSALYFSVTTMITVGYGDIKAKNTNEYIFVIFAMLLASALFGYTTNIVMASFNNSGEIFQQREQMIKRYMNKKKIPTNLKSKVFNYLEWLQQQQLKSQQHEQTIFESLSANLKSELVCLLNGRIIKQIEFLDRFSKDLRSNVAYLLMEQVHGPEETIIEEGTLGTEFFFLSLGKVNCFFQQRKLGSVKMNSCFGHFGFFKQVPRTITIKAKTFVNLMKLNRSQLLMLAQHKESDFEAYHQLMYRVIIENQIEFFQLKCFLCNKESKNCEKKLTDSEKNHIAKYCPRSHYTFKYEQVKDSYKKRSKRTIKRRKKSERFSYYMRSKIYLKALNKIHQQFLIQYLRGQQQSYLEISQEEIESINDNNCTFDIDQIKIFHHYCKEYNFNTIIESWNIIVDERLEELRRKKMIIQSIKFQQLLKQRRLNIQRFKSPSPHIQKKFQDMVQQSVRSLTKSPQVGQVKDRKPHQTPQLKQRLVVVENVRNKRQQSTQKLIKLTLPNNAINDEGSPDKIYSNVKRLQLI